MPARDRDWFPHIDPITGEKVEPTNTTGSSQPDHPLRVGRKERQEAAATSKERQEAAATSKERQEAAATSPVTVPPPSSVKVNLKYCLADWKDKTLISKIGITLKVVIGLLFFACCVSEMGFGMGSFIFGVGWWICRRNNNKAAYYKSNPQQLALAQARAVNKPRRSWFIIWW